MFDSVLQSLLHRSFLQLCDAIEDSLAGKLKDDDEVFLRDFAAKTRAAVQEQRDIAAGQGSPLIPFEPAFAEDLDMAMPDVDEMTPTPRVVDGEDEAAD